MFRVAIYLLVKLARASNLLPTKLWLQGVKEDDTLSPMSGGFSYVWRGEFEGRAVAVKMPVGSSPTLTGEFCQV
jgi:hypothetical protein